MTEVTSKEEAEARVTAFLARAKEGPRYVVNPAVTVEHAVGWGIVITSPEYLQTGDVRHVPIGLAPLIVTRAGALWGSSGSQAVSVSLDDVAAITGVAGIGGRLRHRLRRMLRGPMVERID